MDQKDLEEKVEKNARILTKDAHPYPHNCFEELFGKADAAPHDTKEPNKDRKKQSKMSIYLKHIAQLCVDLFLLFPLYAVVLFFESFLAIKYRFSIDQNIGCIDLLIYFKIWMNYMLDVFLAVCVNCVPILIVYGNIHEMENVYYYWLLSCFFLFFTFNLFVVQTYMNMKDKTIKNRTCFSFRSLLSQDRLDSIGLGNFHRYYLDQIDEDKWNIDEDSVDQNEEKKQQQEDTKKRAEFNVIVQEIAEQQTIDLSLFFFKSMEVQSDITHRKENPLQNEEESALQKKLLKINSDFNLSGLTDILWKGYESNSTLYFTDVPKKIYVLLLLIKVGLPVWYLLSLKSFTLDYLIIIIVSGFYVYQFGIIFGTINNSDLENRYLIMVELNELINFNEKRMEEEGEIEGDGEGEGVGEGEEDDNKETPIRQLDITCPLSLETWDSARRICCLLDINTTESYEASCLCLVMYYTFILLTCVTFYGEIYIVFSQNSFFLHPVMVIQSSVDFAILTWFFLNRLSSGSDYNGTFTEQLEQIDNLIGIYEDLITTFEYYFAPGFDEEVKNIVYKRLIKKIKSNAKYYLKRDPESNKKKDYQGVEYSEATEKVLIMNMMKNSCSSLEKIKKQIMRDKEERKHLIFGYFDLPFKETLSTLILGLLTFIPTIFKRLEIFYNPGATPAPPAPAGISHFH